MLARISSGTRLLQQLALLSTRHRCLLSPAFGCADAWQNRLSAPELSGAGGLSGLDLGNGLMRALDRGESVAPVDIDVYANKLDSFDLTYMDFFTSVLAKFRTTQESLQKLESTDHALVRCMMSMGQTELLIQWLRDKFTYGIFLDQYSASLLIDHLLEGGNTKLAALVSFDHAVQESIADGPVCLGLMLMACAARSAEQLRTVWCAVEPEAAAKADAAAGEDEEETDEDTKHVIVDYIRRPNYDGHFDLEEERLQVGHTLNCISRRLLSDQTISQQLQAQEQTQEQQPSQYTIGLTCALIGSAAEEKPQQFLDLLESHRGYLLRGILSKSTAESADALLASAQVFGDGESATDRRGMRPRCDPAAVESARAALRSLPLRTSEDRLWHEEAAAFARSQVTAAADQATRELRSLYRSFEATRLAELRNHADWLRRRRLFQSVKRQLDGLVEEQEALTAFDNATELRYAAWLAPRTRSERRVTSKAIWQRDVENANRLLEEAARQVGPGEKHAPRVKRTSRVQDKFRPLKE